MSFWLKLSHDELKFQLGRDDFESLTQVKEYLQKLVPFFQKFILNFHFIGQSRILYLVVFRLKPDVLSLY